MTSTKFTPAFLESYIHEVLREELKYLEEHLNKCNGEVEAYTELRNTVEALLSNCSGGFKTQMDIGSNILMTAKVDPLDKILVDLGAGCYLECNFEEAQKLVTAKINILQKWCDVIRDESVKKRAEVKLALLCIAEQQQLHSPDSV